MPRRRIAKAKGPSEKLEILSDEVLKLAKALRAEAEGIRTEDTEGGTSSGGKTLRNWHSQRAHRGRGRPGGHFA